MPHQFRAKTFIGDATALVDTAEDVRGRNPISGQVEDYLESQDIGGSSNDIDEVISVSSCKLSGDRVFTIVVIEDESAGG